MAYSTLKDPQLEVQFRNGVLDMGHELFVLVVKDSIGYTSLKDFVSDKSMVVLNKKFTKEQIKEIRNGLLDFHDLDIATLFQLAKYDCNIPSDDWKIEGTLASYLGKIKNERNEAAHKDLYLSREIVGRKLDEMQCLYRNTLQKLGEMKQSQGGSTIVYQQYADSIVKRLSALRPKVTIEDLAEKMEYISSKLEKMPLPEKHGNNPSSVDQCDSAIQQIDDVNRSSQANASSSVDQCDSAHQQIDDVNETPTKEEAQDNTKEMLKEIAASTDSEEKLREALMNLALNIKSSKPSHYQNIIIQILPSLENYQHNGMLQYYGLFTIYYMAKHLDDFHITISNRLKKRIIETALVPLENDTDDQDTLLNSLDILRMLSGPDMFTKYKRITIAAIGIFHKCKSEELKSTRMTSINLLSNLTVKADLETRETMASTGIIKDILSFTEKCLNENLCDGVLEESWNVLTSLVGSSYSNCTDFVNQNGHSYFQRCHKEFPNNAKLIFYMVMTLSNVIDFQEYREVLMKSTIVETTYDLLLWDIMDYNVSIQAAHFLCLLASAGPTVWVMKYPTRQQVMDRMVAVIERWDPDTDFAFIHVTFKEELRILKDFSSPELQHFVLWTLAWCTKDSAEQHCTLLEEENGLPLIQKIVDSTHNYYRVKQLAQTVIKQCQDFKSKSK